MSAGASSVVPRCLFCGSLCRRPRDGASWVLEWRIGDGPVCEMVTHSAEPTCVVVARIPCSPLPGSHRTLLEEPCAGQRVWWLTIDARTTAIRRLDVLERVAGLVEQALTASVKPCKATCLELRMLAVAELKNARQPDLILELSRRIGLQDEPASFDAEASDALRAQDVRAGVDTPWETMLSRSLLALLRALREEAGGLGHAWRVYEPALARRFDTLAVMREATRTVEVTRPAATPAARPRRFVREFQIPVDAAQAAGVRGATSAAGFVVDSKRDVP